MMAVRYPITAQAHQQANVPEAQRSQTAVLPEHFSRLIQYADPILAQDSQPVVNKRSTFSKCFEFG